MAVLVRLPFETTITAGPVGLMSRPDMPDQPLQQVFQLAVRNVLERNMTDSLGETPDL